MRKVFLTLAIIAAMAIPAPMAAGAPTPEHSRPGAQPLLADRNGNGISDGLEARLGDSDPGALVDVVVTWTQEPDIPAAKAMVGPFKVTAEFGVIDGFAATVRFGQVRALSRVPGVFRVEEDFEVTLALDEVNAEFGFADARADYGVDGSGTTFCILDTGADIEHEQLDQNKVVAYQDFIDPGIGDAFDPHGHGTHVANILAGNGPAPYQGVAPGASLAIGRVLNAQGSGNESGIIAGIDFCIAQSADGMSMSLGGPATGGNDALSQAVRNAVNQYDLIAIVAAGNNGDSGVTTPGIAGPAITVGASWKLSDGLRLAYFSSSGTAQNGKPDVTAPGVNVVAAKAGTTNGYVAFSGTSMATPALAGIVSLMVECSDNLGKNLKPADFKSILTGTSLDLGAPGHDTNWGAGLVDGPAAVAQTCSTSGGMDLPKHESAAGTVPDNGTWTHTITIGPDDLGHPLAATVIIEGELICVLDLGPFGCWSEAWSVDIDGRLIGPDGQTILDESTCPADTECSLGQREFLVTTPTVPGDYTLELYPWDGTGANVVVDIFYGPVGATPAPGNNPPVAVDDPYNTDEDTGLTVIPPGVLENDTDQEDDPLTVTSWAQPANGTVSGNGDGSFTYTPNQDFNGQDTFTYVVTDPAGGTDEGTVTITVDPVNDPPVANAGPDQTVTDDGDLAEWVTLDGSGSTDDGGIVSYAWSEGGNPLAVGATPSVSLALGSHTITLLVTDANGVVDSDDVFITVDPAAPPPDLGTMHVVDLDGTTDVHPRNGRWKASVTVLIEDSGAIPVESATVDFALGDGSTRSCVTDTSGLCTVTSKSLKRNVPSLLFTVTSVTHATFGYDPGSNQESTIEVFK